MWCRAHRKGARRTWAGPVLLVAAFLATAGPAAGLELWANEGGERTLSLDPALKLGLLGSRAPDDAILYPERETAVGLARLRLGFNAALGEQVNAELAYEHRMRLSSAASGMQAGGGVLPSFAEAPLSGGAARLADHRGRPIPLSP